MNFKGYNTFWKLIKKGAFVLLLSTFFCCKTSSQPEININNLQNSFIAKDEAQFLVQFPKTFDQFNSYFGWNSESNQPEELYTESNGYIDYWFNLLDNEKYKIYETDIIGISKNGEWKADAVNYFQDKSLNYIKEKQKYYLINELNDAEAKSALFFLFDSPHPKFDEDFASNLNTEKQNILNEIFETVFYSQHGIEKNEDLSQDNISFYNNNDAYFIKNIDVNNDGVLDKVVSSARYEGDELLLFINNNNSFVLDLKTLNFSADGGNQIVDIKKDDTNLVIVTSFPDGGYFESHHYISFNNNKWILTNTIYKTLSSNQEDAFIYVCDVKQDIDLSNAERLSEIKWMPEESDRDKLCSKIKKSSQQTETVSNDDISGEYELIKGYTFLIGSEDDEIYKAAIIIEQLSETDFGFYSAYKWKDISPIGDFGVLRHYKNTFNILEICDGLDVEGYAKDTFTNGLFLHNQVIIQKKGDTLAMIRYGANFRRYLLYIKKKPQTDFDTSLKKTLKSSKLEYEDFLINYKKAKNYDKSKLQLEYISMNDAWVTKHHHKEDYAGYVKTHYYQDPNQDGRFVKEDSIFMKMLNN